MLKGKIPLLIALALGVFAGLVAWSALRRQKAEIEKGWNLVEVVVANTEISEGSVVTAEMVTRKMVPEQFVTSSVIKADSLHYVLDQRVVVALQAGDPLLWSQFDTTRAQERLSTKILKRGRAISIEAKGVTAVGGWVRQNDHVDVIGTFKDPKDDKAVAVTLMQNVIVLATGKVTGTTNINLVPENQRAYQDVTLQVYADEVELLVLARELGTLTLTLRNEEDMSNSDERSRVTIETLLSGERAKALQKIRYDTIQVIRGNTTASESHKE